MGMFGRIILEILILWVCYAAYMAVLVHKRGPVGGLFFYPQVMIDRVKTLGLITEEEFPEKKAVCLHPAHRMDAGDPRRHDPLDQRREELVGLLLAVLCAFPRRGIL